MKAAVKSTWSAFAGTDPHAHGRWRACTWNENEEPRSHPSDKNPCRPTETHTNTTISTTKQGESVPYLAVPVVSNFYPRKINQFKKTLEHHIRVYKSNLPSWKRAYLTSVSGEQRYILGIGLCIVWWNNLGPRLVRSLCYYHLWGNTCSPLPCHRQLSCVNSRWPGGLVVSSACQIRPSSMIDVAGSNTQMIFLLNFYFICKLLFYF